MSTIQQLDERSPTSFGDSEPDVLRLVADRIDDRPRRVSVKFRDWVRDNYFIDTAFTLKGREPLEEIYADESREIVVIKSAQCGVSEWLIAYSLYFPQYYGENVFYGMPAKDQIKDFVQGRVDPRVDDSVPLQGVISSTDNIDLKRVGGNFIYYRGSQNRRQITSVDAGLLVLDEFDDMIQKHISVMEKRIGASKDKHMRKAGTPSVFEYGIHAEYLRSDQHEYHLKCRKCGKWQAPDWIKNIRPEPTREKSAPDPKSVSLVCEDCGGTLDRDGGKWVAMNPGAKVRGYHVSKLIFKSTDLNALWREYRDTINMQDFYNGNLGLPWAVAGGKLDDQKLDACRRSKIEEDELKKMAPHRGCSMGVDVGAWLNARISRNVGGKKQGVAIGKFLSFAELEEAMNEHGVECCVVDGLPETRMARQFAERNPGRVYLAYYQLNDPHRTIEVNDQEMRVKVNRVRAMDETAARLIERMTRLPANANEVPEYYEQMKAPQKIKTLDTNGNEEYKYVENGKPDHYYHAEVYDDLAAGIMKGREASKVFEEFDDVKQVREPRDIPRDWPRIVGMRTGPTRRCAIVFCAVDEDEGLHVYDEVVRSGKTIDFYAAEIRKRMEGLEYLLVVTPEMLKGYRVRDGVEYSVFQELQEEDLDPVAASGSAAAGIDKIRQLMARGKFYISKNCPATIEGIKRYRWDEGSDDPVGVMDDEVAALRFAAATFFESPEEPAKTIKKGSQEWWDAMEEKQKR
jgi:hypothetical protein